MSISDNSSINRLPSGKPYKVTSGWESFDQQQQADGMERRIRLTPMDKPGGELNVVFTELSCASTGKGARRTITVIGAFSDGFSDASREIRLTYNSRLTSFTRVIKG
ncbi:MAG: hypothetical protein EOO17_03030 [Chloroflexi bacterium]|nr:MAG: hypothetical protein EOO17_03030 [Chloroflexota bacterium]